MKISEFIYDLQNSGIFVYLEDEKLKYLQLKESEEKDKILSVIKEQKDVIREFLKTNGLTTRPTHLDIWNRIYRSKEKVGELSFAQERLWFIEQYQGGSNAYNIPMVFKISKEASLDLIEKSIKSIISRHEVLRTLIQENEEGIACQIVRDDIQQSLVIRRVEVENLEQLDRGICRDINYIYNLKDEYPIRVSIYSLVGSTIDEYYLNITVHHIAFDGWSMDVFLRELYAFYRSHEAALNGNSIELGLPELLIQYKDFAEWQRAYLYGERLNQQLSYWKAKLSGYEAVRLVADHPRPKEVCYQGQDVLFELDLDLSTKLRTLAKDLGVSLYSLLLAGYLLMLRCYSNQNDLVVGTPAANRHYDQIENLIGFFVNSLVLRVQIDPKESVKSLIERIAKEVVEAQVYQDVPFEKLVDELKIIPDTSRH